MSSEKRPLQPTNDQFVTAEQAKNVSITVGKEAVKISMVGGIVAGFLLPGDFVLHMLHTKQPNEKINFFKSSIYATFIKGLTSAYKNSAVAATKKNGIYGNRDTLGDAINGKNKENSPTTEDQVNTPKMNPLTASIVVTTVLGITDTTLTQKNSNYKTWAFESAKRGINLTPNPQNTVERAKAFWAGYPIRGLRNINSIGGLLIQPYFKDRINYFFPGNSSEGAHIIASFMSGVPTGLIANAFDVVYKQQVTQIDREKIKVPSAYQTIKNLIVTQGIRALAKGSVVSVCYSIAAQYIVPKAEQFADEVVNKAIKAISDNYASFFSNKPRAVVKSAEPVENQASEAKSVTPVEVKTEEAPAEAPTPSSVGPKA